MRHYVYSVLLIFIAAVLVTLLPFFTDLTVKEASGEQIPTSNPQVAGVSNFKKFPQSYQISPPAVSAKAVLIEDLNTSYTLYQQNTNLTLPIASTTKIMTALLASDYFKPDSLLTVKLREKIPGSSAGLMPGEMLSFESLLYGMLLNSGNDAAYTLAENYPGGVPGFVSAMNKKAAELDLRDTHFDNPAGFDSPNHYSSASDLATITQEALKKDELRKIFATKETEIVSFDNKYRHKLQNLNQLLSTVRGVLGVKTGYTEEAKENLVTYLDRDGDQILIVVLGSNDRFGETKNLIDWVFKNFVFTQ